MQIKCLVENTSISDDFLNEHGLSIYIESKDKKILFDVGESDLFLKNAKKINLNIAEVDFLVLSHGHYDHGGGLRVFLQENKTAKVFVRQEAFNKQYAQHASEKAESIGLDEDLKHSRQIVFSSDEYHIDKGIWTFSNITQREARPKSNSGLFTEYEGQMIEDIFVHEQNLVIEEDGKTFLMTGCAHNGIINILEHFRMLKGKMPDYVIGGFHLSSRSAGNEDNETIDRIAKYLNDTKAKYYTCHCTGLEPYKKLKATMGDSIDYLSAGREISI
jgi:7,8-dihydropterin-6-yl-methyl-4-(beta-D-ribofuranosyl)aminobenzene 5'-phosphate synthase